MTQLMKYPEGHIMEQHGNKVAWLTYATKELAEQCAIAAKFNAVIISQRGFDFGYCFPGDIKEYEGTYSVTIP